jgi:hypothetical protein
MRFPLIFFFLVTVAWVFLYYFGIIQVNPDEIIIKAGTTSVAATYTSFIVIAGWIVGLLFSVIGLILTGFRKRLYWILLLIFAIAGAGIFYFYIYK